jgi:hypothetical protein
VSLQRHAYRVYGKEVSMAMYVNHSARQCRSIVKSLLCRELMDIIERNSRDEARAEVDGMTIAPCNSVRLVDM